MQPGTCRAEASPSRFDEGWVTDGEFRGTLTESRAAPYQFDRSVVQDNDRSEHGRMDNGTADSMVRGNSNRFQYVPSQERRKDLDC